MRIQVILFLSIALSATAKENSQLISDCLDIDSNHQRLHCFDRKAREIRAQRDPAIATEASQGQLHSGMNTAPNLAIERNLTRLFGSKKPRLQEAVKQIQARIESIRKSAGGKLVMTLDNGQIWVENEPSNRPIRSHQRVTIFKKSWHYNMQLVSGRKVAVHRSKP